MLSTDARQGIGLRGEFLANLGRIAPRDRWRFRAIVFVLALAFLLVYNLA
jgi:hypothetical protein